MVPPDDNLSFSGINISENINIGVYAGVEESDKIYIRVKIFDDSFLGDSDPNCIEANRTVLTFVEDPDYPFEEFVDAIFLSSTKIRLGVI